MTKAKKGSATNLNAGVQIIRKQSERVFLYPPLFVQLLSLGGGQFGHSTYAPEK